MSSKLPAVPWKLLGFVALGLTLGLNGLLRLFMRSRPVREVLFFPTPFTCVEPLLTPGLGCSCRLPHIDTALTRLLTRLLVASRSLELCIFTFSSEPLCRAVLLLHCRGVRVRVITDSDYMACTGSQIGSLRNAGVTVRHNQTSGYMHHKFAVVDQSLVITGSMNWTTQATQSNRENLLITDDSTCVRAYFEEFERLWEDYDPATYNFFAEKENK